MLDCALEGFEAMTSRGQLGVGWGADAREGRALGVFADDLEARLGLWLVGWLGQGGGGLGGRHGREWGAERRDGGEASTVWDGAREEGCVGGREWLASAGLCCARTAAAVQRARPGRPALVAVVCSSCSSTLAVTARKHVGRQAVRPPAPPDRPPRLPRRTQDHRKACAPLLLLLPSRRCSRSPARTVLALDAHDALALATRTQLLVALDRYRDALALDSTHDDPLARAYCLYKLARPHDARKELKAARDSAAHAYDPRAVDVLEAQLVRLVPFR